MRGEDLPPRCPGSLDLVHVAETTPPETDNVETVDAVEGRMEWLNEPASWQRTGDVLTVSVDPGTDFWRETGYGYIRDNGHVYGEAIAGDLDVSVRLRAVLETQFDQAGVMLRADEQTWLKTGIEFFEGRARLSTVLTLGRSSWMVTDLPDGADDILLRVSRRGDAVEVRYLVGEGQPELAALVYMPPGAEVLAGVMAAAPEGPGFRVTFNDLHIAERDWSAAEEDWQEEPAWAGDQAAAPEWTSDQAAAPEWAGDEATAPEWTGPDGAGAAEAAPGWDGEEPGPAPAWAGDQAAAPEWAGPDGAGAAEAPPGWDGEEPEPAPARDGEPEKAGQRDWASGAASEDHPSWPAGGVTPVDESGWDGPTEDDPDWVQKLSAVEEPEWAMAPAPPQDPAPDAAPPSDAVPPSAPPSDAAPDEGRGWATPPAHEEDRARDAAAQDGPADGSSSAGTPAQDEDKPGDAPAQDGLTGGMAGGLAGPEPGSPGNPGQPGDIGKEAWAPAPTLGTGDWFRPVEEDPAADWERLAAGVQARSASAERWTAQTDADVAAEWPGPPLPAARRAAISNGLTAGDGPAKAPPAPSAHGAEAQQDASPDTPADDTPQDDKAGPGPAPNGPSGPAHAKRRGAGRDPTAPSKTAAPRPPLDLAGLPDPADEWISLLTADPADE